MPTVEERVKKLDADWEISSEVHWPEEVLADIHAEIRAAVDEQREKDAKAKPYTFDCPKCEVEKFHPCFSLENDKEMSVYHGERWRAAIRAGEED